MQKGAKTLCQYSKTCNNFTLLCHYSGTRFATIFHLLAKFTVPCHTWPFVTVSSNLRNSALGYSSLLLYKSVAVGVNLQVKSSFIYYSTSQKSRPTNSPIYASSQRWRWHWQTIIAFFHKLQWPKSPSIPTKAQSLIKATVANSQAAK